MSSIFSTLLFQKPNVDRQMNDEIRKKILYEYKIEDEDEDFYDFKTNNKILDFISDQILQNIVAEIAAINNDDKIGTINIVTCNSKDSGKKVLIGSDCVNTTFYMIINKFLLKLSNYQSNPGGKYLNIESVIFYELTNEKIDPIEIYKIKV